MAVNSSYAVGQEVHFYDMVDDQPRRVDLRITRVKDEAIHGIVLESVPGDEPEIQPGDIYEVDISSPDITDDEDVFSMGNQQFRGLMPHRLEFYDEQLDDIYS